MSIFNSLGSNYDFKYVYKSLFSFYDASKDLEELLEEKYGGEAILLYKGREAIQLALKILDLPKDSFVAINGFTCFAVYDAVKKAGLKCEYLDIERGELNFSAETLQKKVKENPKVKAVIIQNTLGYPCQIKEIAKICKENGISLIEDLAHSVGTRYEEGSEVGTIGDFTVLSFSQDKMIDGISGGALIVRNNQDLEEELSKLSFKQQIIDKLYPIFTFKIRVTYSIFIGKLLHFILKKINLLSRPMDGAEEGKFHKLPNWYTKLIRDEFNNLSENLSHRKNIASIYNQMIDSKVISKSISEKISSSSNLRFPIFVNNREALIKHLAKQQIFVSDIWYDAPIAPKKYLSQTDYSGQCPNAELASSAILNLPTHKNVTEKDAQYISQLVNKWLKQ